jgi:hypothetical protein
MTYRRLYGSFAGAVVVESNTLINARMRVALSGADQGLTLVSGDVLDQGQRGTVARRSDWPFARSKRLA